MAFKSNGQNYYLIAKHSGKLLSLPASNNDRTIEQQSINQQLRQQFKIIPGDFIHWIKPASMDEYLTIHAQSKAEAMPVLYWHWDTGIGLRYRFIYAGGGAYRIVNLNSFLPFDIYGGSALDGAKLNQDRLNSGDNQLFTPVIVPGQALGENPKSYVELNDKMRTYTMAMIGAIPKAGTALKFLTAMFWKEGNVMADYWVQMKTYVDERIRQMLVKEKVDRLEGEIRGLMEIIKEIQDSKKKNKGERLTMVIDLITLLEKEFMTANIIELMPYLVGLGTIAVSARALMVTDYEFFYNGEKPTAEVMAENKEYLQKTIDKYIKAVKEAQEASITWRLGHVKDRESSHSHASYKGGSTDISSSAAEDKFDGWKQVWSYSIVMSGMYVRYSGPTDHKERADFAVAQRRAQIKVQYTSELEELMLIAESWKYMHPDVKKPAPVKVQKTVGTFGNAHAGTEFKAQPNKKITAITVHSFRGGNVCGIEVSYNGTSAGLVGKKGNEEATLTVGDNDSFNGVFGFAKDHITGLGFTTRSGKMLLAGARDGRGNENHFDADLADGLNNTLVGISGSHDGNSLLQISFTWEYEV